MTFESAASTADPNSPTLESHASRRRRCIFCSSALPGPFGCSLSIWSATSIPLLLEVHQFFQVRPEHLKLGVFYVAEIILLDGKDEHTHRGQPHRQAGHDRHPRQFHLDMSGAGAVSFISLERRAKSPIVALRKTAAIASCASNQTKCAAQPLSRGHAPSDTRQRFRRSGPSIASTISSMVAALWLSG